MNNLILQQEIRRLRQSAIACGTSDGNSNINSNVDTGTARSSMITTVGQRNLVNRCNIGNN